MIEAEVVRDSVSGEGKRLTTFKLRYPKFIHGEFMTHRVFSRNASSSRAIPVAKMIEEVRSDALRAAPVSWGKNQPGMQAAEELDDSERRHLIGRILGDEGTHVTDLEFAKATWRRAALGAAIDAEQLAKIGAHKQIANRVLEPFLHINVICTATEYDNFFGLRLDKAAQPEMRGLAEVMWMARVGSMPTTLKPGEWHLPFVSDEDADALIESYYNRAHPKPVVATEWDRILDDLTKTSVARCARVSYESHETGKRSTIKEDMALHDRLLASKHLSPFEHQATPDSEWGGFSSGWQNPNEHGNFVGWRQYRKTLAGEAVAQLPEGYGP